MPRAPGAAAAAAASSSRRTAWGVPATIGAVASGASSAASSSPSSPAGHVDGGGGVGTRRPRLLRRPQRVDDVAELEGEVGRRADGEHLRGRPLLHRREERQHEGERLARPRLRPDQRGAPLAHRRERGALHGERRREVGREQPRLEHRPDRAAAPHDGAVVGHGGRDRRHGGGLRRRRAGLGEQALGRLLERRAAQPAERDGRVDAHVGVQRVAAALGLPRARAPRALGGGAHAVAPLLEPVNILLSAASDCEAAAAATSDAAATPARRGGGSAERVGCGNDGDQEEAAKHHLRRRGAQTHYHQRRSQLV